MNNETQILAAKLLAQILTGEDNQTKNSDAAEILARLDEMNTRLVAIEGKINHPDSQASETTFVNSSFPVFAHSSQERFAIENDSGIEKACRFEPGGKPCDDCAMCSSRGF